MEKAGRAWASELSKIMYQGVIDSRTRFALFALLVSELSLFRWIAVGAVLSAFASVGIVFFYPIEADTLLILNLLILALAGLLCGYLAVVFERDGVLSNVVCNRPQKGRNFRRPVFIHRFAVRSACGCDRPGRNSRRRRLGGRVVCDGAYTGNSSLSARPRSVRITRPKRLPT